MSIVETGNIAQGYLVVEQIDDVDTWCCIRDVNIIDGIICYYFMTDDYEGAMIDNKKEEDWELVELEIGDIYNERLFYKFLEEETEY